MAVIGKKTTLPRTMLCPCRSGWMIVSCCGRDSSDGNLHKAVPSLAPPRPATGFSHPSCYLRDTCDCSEQISREHYVSASVLEQLGGALDVSGMPWQAPDQTQKLTINNLTAKILCTRHNNALSPLDAEAAKFFGWLIGALSDLERKSSSRKLNLYLVSGSMIELWMLKTALGIYHSIGSDAGAKLSETHAIDLAKARLALLDGIWEERAGLYLFAHVGLALKSSPGIIFAPLSDDPTKRFCGLRISLLSMLTMDLLFDAATAKPGPWPGLIRQPSELRFDKDGRHRYIILTWPEGTPEHAVHMSNTPPAGATATVDYFPARLK
jgi:hypothetical protein